MKVGIVGGGLMGLVLAREISKTNAKVKVFENLFGINITMSYYPPIII